MINNSFLSPLKEIALAAHYWMLTGNKKEVGCGFLGESREAARFSRGHRNQDDTRVPRSFHPETLKLLGLNQLCSPSSISGTDGKQRPEEEGWRGTERTWALE